MSQRKSPSSESLPPSPGDSNSTDDAAGASPPLSSTDPQSPAGDLACHDASNLTPIQCRALEHLMSGQSISDAARSAGIGRATFYRWMNQDPHFQAAYNTWQKEMQSAARTSILALTQPAFRALAGALENGDAKTALTLLKSIGLLTPPTPGSTDVDTVQKEQKIAQKRKETRLFYDDLAAGFPE